VPTDESGQYRTDALAFLRRCWPFQVSGAKAKKLKKVTPDGKLADLHELWLSFAYDGQPYIDVPRCVDGNWLDWTGENVRYKVPNARHRKRLQDRFEVHLERVGGAIDPDIADFVLARNGRQDIPYATDPEVADIFREAQRQPAVRKGGFDE
jgi:hypothetical protein